MAKKEDEVLENTALESYCFNIKQTVEDETLKEVINEDVKKQLLDKCQETRLRFWLLVKEDNQQQLTANKKHAFDEIEHRLLKELEAFCDPIITRLYQSAAHIKQLREARISIHNSLVFLVCFLFASFIAMFVLFMWNDSMFWKMVEIVNFWKENAKFWKEYAGTLEEEEKHLHSAVETMITFPLFLERIVFSSTPIYS